MKLKGVVTPVVTVFREDESIDEQGYRRIVEYLIEHGVSGIFPCGGQGEGYSLTHAEKLRILDLTLETVKGRLPVLMGAGGITTRLTVEQVASAKEHGADAAVVITPYYISPTQDELYRHYAAVLDAVDIPLYIYNNPWRTHLNIQPETVARLRTAYPNMRGIKDSSGDLGMTLNYKRLCGDEFEVFIGRDQLILAGLLSGLDGAVAATSNAAVDIVTGIYREFAAGNFEKARVYQERLVPFREFFSAGTFPVVVKEAMMLQGLPSGPCRRPVGPISEAKRAELKVILSGMGLL
jgi:4-hydroxy-tetrahydrodipicolinate synthase